MEKVVIRKDFCKGCELCIGACKKDVLEIGTESNKMGYRYVVAAKKENCISCTMCAVMCPESAIEIYK